MAAGRKPMMMAMVSLRPSGSRPMMPFAILRTCL